MTRKTLGLLVLGGGLALAGAAVGLRWATRQAPDFYAEAVSDPPAPAVREAAARKFAERTAALVEDLRYAATWEQEFTQNQVNAWLALEMPERYGRQVPKEVSEPRVAFDDGLVRVGFRLDARKFRGIVSLDLRPSVPEPNRLAIAVESLYAGLLPLSPHAFTDDVSRQLDKHGVEHEWRDDAGRPVLVVTVVPNRGDRPVLEQIQVGDEKLRITGHREEPATLTMRSAKATAGRL